MGCRVGVARGTWGEGEAEGGKSLRVGSSSKGLIEKVIPSHKKTFFC